MPKQKTQNLEQILPIVPWYGRPVGPGLAPRCGPRWRHRQQSRELIEVFVTISLASTHQEKNVAMDLPLQASYEKTAPDGHSVGQGRENGRPPH